jgi:uncharacterized protein YndB with AHSA1/START domain
MNETAPIVRSVEIAASAERVFELLTDADELVRWWPDAVELEPEVGGRVRLVFANGHEVTGRVTRFEPPRALGFTWGWPDRPGVETQVDFTVSDLGERGCEVRVTHAGWEGLERLRPDHERGWAHFLALLAALAENRPFEKTLPSS